MASKFDHSLTDENRGYTIYITIGILTVVILVTTFARVITKVATGLKLTWDDYLVVLGTILNLIANGFDAKATSSGFGRHRQFLTRDGLIDAQKYAQLAVGVATWAIWAVKISICFFLLGIIRGTHKYFTWFIRFLIAITTITSFIGGLLWGLQASPLPKLWDDRIPGTRVSPERFLSIVYVTYSFGVVTDLIYSLSPIYFLWGVKLPLKRKLTILSLTGCGILVTVVGFFEIVYAPDFLETKDATWVLVNEFICDIIERNVSAIIANVPALWILASRLRQQFSSHHSQLHSTDLALPGSKGTNNTQSIGIARKQGSLSLHTDPSQSWGVSHDPDDRQVPLRDVQRPTGRTQEDIRVDTQITVNQGKHSDVGFAGSTVSHEWNGHTAGLAV